jgi:hypothetical protein
VRYSILTTENTTVVTNSAKKQNFIGYFYDVLNNSTAKNSGIVKLYIPRFIQGNGSMIKIVTFTDSQENNNYRNYNVYTTYDQGSTWRGVFKKITFEDIIKSQWSTVVLILSYTPIVSIYSYVAWKRYIRSRYKKRIRHLTEYMKIIDSTYNTLNYNNEECLRRLYDIQKEFTEEFKKGIIPEWQYDLLNRKIVVYVSSLEDIKNSKKDTMYIG